MAFLQAATGVSPPEGGAVKLTEETIVAKGKALKAMLEDKDDV
jgi:hypothetical protein